MTPNGLARRGRISWPYPNLGAAVAAAGNNQRILLYPGYYDEAVTITRRLNLVVPHGGVVIGAPAP